MNWEAGGLESTRPLLKTTAAARILKLSLSRVRQLGDAGALTTVRSADGARLFDAQDVERMRIARSRPTSRTCRFCGTDVHGQATYCRREFCQRARNRLKQQRFTQRFKARHGMTYRSARRRKRSA